MTANRTVLRPDPVARAVVALVGAGHMPAPSEDEREEAKLFYVGATRATQRLIIGMGGKGRFSSKI
jgi:superfamily I DNA/RNA helicase